MKKRFFQAFQQAPWRIQVQRAGLILVVLVCIALTAGLYLTISASTYAAGIRAQEYGSKKEKLQREIADLKTRQALATTDEVMVERSKVLGYEEANPYNFVYMVIPGYRGRQIRVSTITEDVAEKKPSLIKPAFQESLWEWFCQFAINLSENSDGGM